MAMFAPYSRRREAEDKKDVFAPVADLMVGVVFVFILLVLALSLNIVDEAQNVPRAWYDEQKNKADALAQQLDQATSERDAAFRLAAEQKDRADREEASHRRLADFARYVQDTGVIPVLGRLAQANNRRTKILEKIRDSLDRMSAGNIKVDIDPENGTLRLPSGKLFESLQADPTPKGREIIRSLGVSIADVVPCYLSERVRPADCPMDKGAGVLSAIYIEGHTDFAPLRGETDRFRDNWDLSAARAIEAFKIVSAADPRIPGLKNGEGKALIGVSGYAETRPVREGASEQERMKPEVRDVDRRIEVRLVMAVDKQEVEATLRDLQQRLESLDADLR